MNHNLHIQRSNFFVEERANKLNEELANIVKLVSNLKIENETLKRIYDLSIIHLLQIQDDLEMNRQIFNKMRVKVDGASSPSENLIQPNNIISNLTQMNELQISNMQYEVEPNNINIKLKASIRTNNLVCSVCFQNTGENIVFSNGKTVFIVSINDGKMIQSFNIPNSNNIHDYTPRSIRVSPDSLYIALGGPDNAIIIYSIEQNKIIANLEAHQKQISSLLFSNDSTILYSSGYDGILCVWDLQQMALKQMIKPQKDSSNEMIVSLSKDPNEYFIATGLLNGSVGIYEPTFQQPMNSFQAHESNQCLLNLSISPFDGTFATSSHDKTIKIWNLHGVASCRRILQSHTDIILTICFSPLQSICFSAGKDESIKCWDYKKGELLFTLKGHRNTLFEIAHHPFQKIFASCSGDGMVCIWEYVI